MILQPAGRTFGPVLIGYFRMAARPESSLTPPLRAKTPRRQPSINNVA